MSLNTPFTKKRLGQNRNQLMSDSRSVQVQASVSPPACAHPSGGSISSISTVGNDARRASTSNYHHNQLDHFKSKPRRATPSPAARAKRPSVTAAAAAKHPPTTTVAKRPPAIAATAPSHAGKRHLYSSVIQ